MSNTKYIIVKEKDIKKEDLDKIDIENVVPIPILKDDETETFYYVVKLDSLFSNAFPNHKKLDKETVKSYIERVKLGEVFDSDIQYKIEDKDPTGRDIIRIAATQKGWHTQIHSIEIRTASSWYYNHDKEGNDLNNVLITYLDENGSTTTEENAVRTVVDWMPNYNYEIIAGKVTQQDKPSEDVRFWVEGLPEVKQVPFGQGGINLKKIGQHNEVSMDGRAPKNLEYTIYGTNKLRFFFLHPKGFNHDIQILLEIYVNEV